MFFVSPGRAGIIWPTLSSCSLTLPDPFFRALLWPTSFQGSEGVARGIWGGFGISDFDLLIKIYWHGRRSARGDRGWKIRAGSYLGHSHCSTRSDPSLKLLRLSSSCVSKIEIPTWQILSCQIFTSVKLAVERTGLYFNRPRRVMSCPPRPLIHF